MFPLLSVTVVCQRNEVVVSTNGNEKKSILFFYLATQYNKSASSQSTDLSVTISNNSSGLHFNPFLAMTSSTPSWPKNSMVSASKSKTVSFSVARRSSLPNQSRNNRMLNRHFIEYCCFQVEVDIPFILNSTFATLRKPCISTDGCHQHNATTRAATT
jgi:hypothetical protein